MKKELFDNQKKALNLDLIQEITEPPLFQVVMHNDDFTPMEFVVEVLEQIFLMDRRKATEVMLEVHIRGKGDCGVFTRDIADTRVTQVVEYARRNEFPLICSLEPAEPS